MNIALTKFETALQVSVLIWVLFYGMALSKGCLLNIWIDSETCHVTLSVCHVVCLCLSVRLSALYLSFCLCPPGCSCLSLNLSVCDCLSVSLLHICPPVRRPVPLLVCLSSCLHLCLPACLLVSLPVCLSAHLSVGLFISLNIDKNINLQNIKTVYCNSESEMFAILKM